MERSVEVSSILGDTRSVQMGSEVSIGLVGEINLVRVELIFGRWHIEQVFTYLKDLENLKFMDEGGHLSPKGHAPFPLGPSEVYLGC